MLPCKVLIADDHPSISFGLRVILPSQVSTYQFEFDIAKDGSMVLNFLKDTKYDLLILDMNMPGTDIFKIIDIIVLEYPNTKILVYSTNSESVYAQRLLKMGVLGYLHKSAGYTEIRDAVSQVLRGVVYVSESIRNTLLKKTPVGSRKHSNPFSTLSDRELEVSRMLLQGLGNDGICKALNLRNSTISTYKKRLFEKLDVQNLYELIEMGKMYDMIPKPKI